MRARTLIQAACHIAGCMAAIGTAVAQSTALVPPGHYALTTETVLPHLEEALRYATTRTTRCLAGDSADSFFPLLQHQALTGCSLSVAAEAGTFTLSCRNPEAATGVATFEHSHSSIRAVLELKMGGKNMTLSQRVMGSRLGDCR